MKDYAENEELQFSEHFYGYVVTILIAGFSLFLVSVEPEILKQYRLWISPQTLNAHLLVWFAVSVITGILSFFYGMASQMFRRKSRVLHLIWYAGILSVTLLFSTIFYDVFMSPEKLLIGVILGILILSNIVTAAFSAFFYFLHFEQRHNFTAFALGIMAATTAYNWLYLS
ncbi:MAG: hypothetical protein PHW79_05525, partial [Candidatus Marinimicrobia bacterium]|nr:hypothetical protein [Candidatus Neomarinimicrobiota bacterium]